MNYYGLLSAPRTTIITDELLNGRIITLPNTDARTFPFHLSDWMVDRAKLHRTEKTKMVQPPPPAPGSSHWLLCVPFTGHDPLTRTLSLTLTTFDF